jgi:hypothetical protein
MLGNVEQKIMCWQIGTLFGEIRHGDVAVSFRSASAMPARAAARSMAMAS